MAMFNMAIDCKLRSCDLVKLLVRDISRNGEVLDRAQVIQQKTSQPVQFEITKKTRESVEAWIELRGLSGMDYLWPSRMRKFDHITTHQYARLVKKWITSICSGSMIPDTNVGGNIATINEVSDDQKTTFLYS
ncbi:hypothetical protein [Marinobacter sp. V034]|uniref:hypothetical protein n=1 Tax=Marinobacter sp. V034 TaxID=3459610 RepID=UPI0040440040